MMEVPRTGAEGDSVSRRFDRDAAVSNETACEVRAKNTILAYDNLKQGASTLSDVARVL
jgi:hypothetical protein